MAFDQSQNANVGSFGQGNLNPYFVGNTPGNLLEQIFRAMTSGNWNLGNVDKYGFVDEHWEDITQGRGVINAITMANRGRPFVEINKFFTEQLGLPGVGDFIEKGLNQFEPMLPQFLPENVIHAMSGRQGNPALALRHMNEMILATQRDDTGQMIGKNRDFLQGYAQSYDEGYRALRAAGIDIGYGRIQEIQETIKNSSPGELGYRSYEQLREMAETDPMIQAALGAGSLAALTAPSFDEQGNVRTDAEGNAISQLEIGAAKLLDETRLEDREEVALKLDNLIKALESSEKSITDLDKQIGAAEQGQKDRELKFSDKWSRTGATVEAEGRRALELEKQTPNKLTETDRQKITEYNIYKEEKAAFDKQTTESQKQIQELRSQRSEYEKYVQKITTETFTFLDSKGYANSRERLGLTKEAQDWTAGQASALLDRENISRESEQLRYIGSTLRRLGVPAEMANSPIFIDQLRRDFAPDRAAVINQQNRSRTNENFLRYLDTITNSVGGLSSIDKTQLSGIIRSETEGTSLSPYNDYYALHIARQLAAQTAAGADTLDRTAARGQATYMDIARETVSDTTRVVDSDFGNMMGALLNSGKITRKELRDGTWRDRADLKILKDAVDEGKAVTSYMFESAFPDVAMAIYDKNANQRILAETPEAVDVLTSMVRKQQEDRYFNRTLETTRQGRQMRDMLSERTTDNSGIRVVELMDYMTGDENRDNLMSQARVLQQWSANRAPNDTRRNELIQKLGKESDQFLELLKVDQYFETETDEQGNKRIKRDADGNAKVAGADAKAVEQTSNLIKERMAQNSLSQSLYSQKMGSDVGFEGMALKEAVGAIPKSQLKYLEHMEDINDLVRVTSNKQVQAVIEKAEKEGRTVSAQEAIANVGGMSAEAFMENQEAAKILQLEKENKLTKVTADNLRGALDKTFDTALGKDVDLKLGDDVLSTLIETEGMDVTLKQMGLTSKITNAEGKEADMSLITGHQFKKLAERFSDSFTGQELSDRLTNIDLSKEATGNEKSGIEQFREEARKFGYLTPGQLTEAIKSNKEGEVYKVIQDLARNVDQVREGKDGNIKASVTQAETAAEKPGIVRRALGSIGEGVRRIFGLTEEAALPASTTTESATKSTSITSQKERVDTAKPDPPKDLNVNAANVNFNGTVNFIPQEVHPPQPAPTQ